MVKYFHRILLCQTPVRFFPSGNLQMLENYFIQRNLGRLISYKNMESVEKNTKRLIVNRVVDFMVTTFGDIKEITSNRRRMTALATIALFPCFRYNESISDGTVSRKSIFWNKDCLYYVIILLIKYILRIFWFKKATCLATG